MATAIDVGDTYNIHPSTNPMSPIASFLPRGHVAYGEDLIISGPVYDKMAVEGNAIRVSFTNLGPGLTIGTPPHKPTMKRRSRSPISSASSSPAPTRNSSRPRRKSMVIPWSSQVPMCPTPSPSAIGGLTAPRPIAIARTNFPRWPFRSDDWNDVISPTRLSPGQNPGAANTSTRFGHSLILQKPIPCASFPSSCRSCLYYSA